MVRSTLPVLSAVVPDLVRGPRAHGLAAELLWGNVRYCFGQLPTVTGEVLEGAVALAVVPIDGCLDDHGAVVARPGEGYVDVGNPDPNEMADPAWLRRLSFGADIGDDDRTVVADGHLGAMTLTYTRALDEAESGAQECHRCAYIRVDENRH